MTFPLFRGAVMGERVTVWLGANGSLELSLAEEDGCWPALLLVNIALSVLACSSLVVVSSQRPLLAALALLIATDSLLSQGMAVLFHPPTPCLPLAFSALFFLVLQITFMASFSFFPSSYIPTYLHLLIPLILASFITIPFLFPQVAVARYFYSRRNCGFISLSKTHSVLTLFTGFVFPLCTLYYLSSRTYLPFYNGTETKNEKLVIILISICSVLLIPHIIQINITHFSVTLLKSNLDIQTESSNMYEIFFVWLRYSFNVITPIVILCAEKDVVKEWKYLYYLCFKSNSVAKYLKNRTKFKLISTKKHTPILFLTNEGLMLRINNATKDIDVPYDFESLKLCSSTSAEFSTPSQEKIKVGKKKIVRFAHSVNEITLKNSEWDSSSD